MNRNLVGSIIGRSSIKIAHFVPIHYQTWLPQAILVSDWSISKNLLLWNSLDKWSETWYEVSMECPLYSREATHRFRTSNNAKSNPEIKGCNSIFFRHDALQVSGHALFTSTPHVFLLNIFINKTERSIHFYWIHFLNKIVTWLTREYVYLWYRLLEINVGTRDTAADEML
jgi:hypothetical protein